MSRHPTQIDGHIVEFPHVPLDRSCKPASEPTLGSLVSDCSWQLAFASLNVVLCALLSDLLHSVADRDVLLRGDTTDAVVHPDSISGALVHVWFHLVCSCAGFGSLFLKFTPEACCSERADSRQTDRQTDCQLRPKLVIDTNDTKSVQCKWRTFPQIDPT